MKSLKLKELSQMRDFWLLFAGQSLSQMGSAMTSFALIIWAYRKQGTVMSIASLSVFSYLPYVIVSIFAGAVIDKFKKKNILLVCDAAAALCTLCTLGLYRFGLLEVWHLYFLNAVSGFMNAFQNPASNAAVSIMVPTEQYTRVSGLRSLSESLSSVLSPVAATALMYLAGIDAVFMTDLLTFAAAFVSLLVFIKIPHKQYIDENASIIKESMKGLIFLKEKKGFLYLIMYLAIINFISAMAFYGVLPAMILTRTSDNETILGLVQSAVGLGGIAGGLLVSIAKPSKNHVRNIFVSGALSFLLCDIFMGVGRNQYVWITAAFAGNFTIPLLCASENHILMSKIPEDIRGRVFAVRGTLQCVTLPFGYLAGGLLADKVSEPLMEGTGPLQRFIAGIVGNAGGSGMAFMFIITGTTGFLISLVFCRNRHIRALEE
jgi:DHA3 family macrolide efflux protein-like MFS transporter